MAPQASTHTLGPPEPTLPCLDPSCIRRFFSKNGRSNHVRAKHPDLVPDLRQQANTPTSADSTSNSQMSSPQTYNMPLDSRSQSSESDHIDHIDYRDNDRNSADEMPVDDLDLNLDVPFDGGEYQHLNDQSPGPSDAGSYDQAHEPTLPSIKRTYHPIINGMFLVLLMIFHIYSQFTFRDDL